MSRLKFKQRIIVILGPTASGKSELAVKIAKKFNGEIISADSRQVYKGLNIGSGKVSLKPYYKNIYICCDRTECRQKQNKKILCYKNIPHYLIDVASPKKTFTVSQYQKLAENALKNIIKREKLPIVCGGTGLYIDALIYDKKFPEVPPQPKLRKHLEKKPTEKLFQQLEKLDPRRAQNIDKHNRRRLIRALEIIITTKKIIPPLNQEIPTQTAILSDSGKEKSQYEYLKIGIKKSPEELKKLIAKRLKKRLKQGMIKEVKNLHYKKGLSWKRLDDLGLEYRYVSRYLRELITKKEMIESIEKESWRYVKRQLTWFKRDKGINWIANERETNKLVKEFINN